ncbi:unnamed protein product [Microthlaspi erraticum]|uniref:J domain-containing protein n=1 Tax=Microthlaspi erraticum TaxID=1685480 RepID=A0A6D2L5V8_9BRAS|nr:unnamed protein product [Microthlaspi erraticum]
MDEETDNHVLYLEERIRKGDSFNLTEWPKGDATLELLVPKQPKPKAAPRKKRTAATKLSDDSPTSQLLKENQLLEEEANQLKAELERLERRLNTSSTMSESATSPCSERDGVDATEMSCEDRLLKPRNIPTPTQTFVEGTSTSLEEVNVASLLLSLQEGTSTSLEEVNVASLLLSLQAQRLTPTEPSPAKETDYTTEVALTTQTDISLPPSTEGPTTPNNSQGQQLATPQGSPANETDKEVGVTTQTDTTLPQSNQGPTPPTNNQHNSPTKKRKLTPSDSETMPNKKAVDRTEEMAEPEQEPAQEEETGQNVEGGRGHEGSNLVGCGAETRTPADDASITAEVVLDSPPAEHDPIQQDSADPIININKAEALRAKDMAQDLMRNSHFSTARTVAAKAREMDKTLEKIDHMIMVCDVHCALSESRNETDWYKILQVDQNADYAAIKKQYNKLARYLHPDKNKFPGAESAFNTITEARSVLLDNTKRIKYDDDRKGKTPAPSPQHQASYTQPVSKTNVDVEAANSFTTGLRPEYLREC